MKVLHLPTSVGGNSWGLAQGERALGLESDVLSTTQNWLNYRADITLDLQDASTNLGKFVRLVSAFFALRKKYDVFHFNAGSSLVHSPSYGLNQLDLPFYPEKAKLFVTYNGCDARQKFPTMQRTRIAACHNPNCYHGMCEYGRYDDFRRRAIEKMHRHVTHMWALNPDLLYFLPSDKSSFLPYTVSWEGLEWAPPKLGKRLTIVHAPTNREAKGSDFILVALDRLRQTHGQFVEVLLVENVPHRQALEIYRGADLVIDQILVGWYGGFAAETMKMGKPVIARIAQEDLHFIPRQMAEEVLATIISADPDSIYDVLVRCAEDRGLLKERSEASLAYVEKWHDPKYVASLTKEKYETA